MTDMDQKDLDLEPIKERLENRTVDIPMESAACRRALIALIADQLYPQFEGPTKKLLADANALVAEVERLREERDHLRKELTAIVDDCPYVPDTASFTPGKLRTSAASHAVGQISMAYLRRKRVRDLLGLPDDTESIEQYAFEVRRSRISREDERELPAEWKLDCWGKQDFDGPILRFSTRYYPSGYGNPAAPYEAYSDIYLCYGKPLPGEPDGTDLQMLVERKFTGSSEADAKRQVEEWLSEQIAEIARKLVPWKS